MGGFAEGSVELLAEVGAGEAGRLGHVGDGYGVVVAGVYQVFRADEVACGWDGRHGVSIAGGTDNLGGAVGSLGGGAGS